MTQTRWHLKKAARHGLAVLAWGTGYVALDQRLGPKPKIRALTYHRFRCCARDPFSVDVTGFEAQIRWLADQNLAISLADLQAFLAGRLRIRDEAVLVTIDDGYREVWSVALPILRRYAIPAVVFVSTADIWAPDASEPGSPAANEESRHLSPRDLADLAEAQLAVGSHSWQHRSLGRMTRDEAAEQVTKSKRDLEAFLGRAVTAFAYPFGTRRDFNAKTRRVLADAGYEVAFTSQHGAIVAGTDPLTLPRIKVEGGEPLWMFKLLVSGALDAWRLVDAAFWRFQQNEASAWRWRGDGTRSEMPAARPLVHE